MQTERVAIADLNLDPANVRRHPARNLDAIKASLTRFGQQRPVLVNAKGIVIAGNGTVMAAKALGWEDVAVVRTALEGSEATAYAIADNRTAELAQWDEEALAQQLAALQIDDAELAAAAGFSDAEIAELADATVEVQEDEVPEPPADPITKPGDLWLLGEHRLLCGDATKEEDVKRLMSGQHAVLMLSDPPYNVGYEYSDHADDMSDSDYQAFCDAYMQHGMAVSQMQVITPGKSNERRYTPIEYMVWFKGFGLSLGSFYKAMVTEPILLFGKKPINRFYSTDHFHIGTEREPGLRELHSCPKPVKLFAELMQPMTDLGDLVYEAFCGSGTTLIAAEQLGRKCYGMEISPAYCDVIVKRWETLTGKTAVLADGKTKA
jgi:DNA modification methylase